MNIQIDIIMKRSRGYWFVDGFTEMAVGGLFILLAGILLLRGNILQAAFPTWFLSIAGEIAIAKFVGILAAILILWWLKDNFTYPRTGFVRGNRVTAAQILILIRNIILFLLLPIFGMLAASLFIASTGSVLSSMPAWFPVELGFLWAVLIVLAGEWMGLRRFRLLGVLILLAGMTIGSWQFAMGLPAFPANVGPEPLQPSVLEIINRTLSSLSFLVLISGVLLMFSGLVTFLRYRKENPTPYTEDI
ncbi:MAG: hypothetical protein MUO77_17900 [Anaerolineales bacterium]|nr:hypothetical protein [Anaerolineales bacterium]